MTWCRPIATESFGGLSPTNKAPSPHKLKYETLYFSGVFVNFLNVKPHAQTQSLPTEDFLATGLTWNWL